MCVRGVGVQMGCEGLRLGLVITVLSSVLSQRDRDVSIVVAFVNWLGPIIEIPLKRKIAKMPKMKMEMAEREEYCYEHLTVSSAVKHFRRHC